MAYPASVSVETPERVANWRPLLHWLMAIPHIIITAVLSYVSQIVGLISWFIILFTGRLPSGLAGLQVLYLRYNTRVNAYVGFLHEQYPPFSFEMTAEEPGGTPVTVSFEPQLDDRNRLTTLVRLILAIPAFIFSVIVGLISLVCHVLGFFAVLFTGRWPGGLRNWIVSVLGVELRLSAYMTLLTDEYPPFSLDA
ncbi:DUF4389 domain-containing protein [Candidatus Poriferisodalis sp.]|uniref:DUF4389 domain-containing protein n=1 Tax=Candidatus Poriferisodalis sp. TaxID=3101277 RepID=UPI003C6FEDF6